MGNLPLGWSFTSLNRSSVTKPALCYVMLCDVTWRRLPLLHAMRGPSFSLRLAPLGGEYVFHVVRFGTDPFRFGPDYVSGGN